MNCKITLALSALFLCGVSQLKAQTYTPKISKDSLTTLNASLGVLKATQKLYELKIEEAKQELEVEKLRVKLLAANDDAKDSAAKSSKHVEKMGTANVNVSAAAKIAKKAKSDMEAAHKALEKYNKQIKEVDKIRDQIIKEESKLKNNKPTLKFVY